MVTLESLDQKVGDFKENTEYGLDKINDHLKTLNGKVATNTEFRWKIMGGFAVVSFIGITTIVGMILLWLRVVGIE